MVVTSKGNEAKDETPVRYAHAEIRTRVVVICGPTRYQLDHGGDHLPTQKDTQPPTNPSPSAVSDG